MTIDELLSKLPRWATDAIDRVHDHLVNVLRGLAITYGVQLDDSLNHTTAKGGWNGALHWLLVVQPAGGPGLVQDAEIIDVCWKGVNASVITVDTTCRRISSLRETEIHEYYPGPAPTAVTFTFHFQHGKPITLDSNQITSVQGQVNRIEATWAFADAVKVSHGQATR